MPALYVLLFISTYHHKNTTGIISVTPWPIKLHFYVPIAIKISEQHNAFNVFNIVLS